MESQPNAEASFSEFFQSLREETELYVRANKPPPSVRARRLSPGEDGVTVRLQALERENQRLAARVRQLEAENQALRTKSDCPLTSTDKYANRLAAALNRLEGKASPEKLSDDSKQRRRGKSGQLEWLLHKDSLSTSMSESLEGIKVFDLQLETGTPDQGEQSVSSLKEEVSKHKAFIHHLKRSLQDLLIERLQEREEHLRTKSKLDHLLKNLGSKAA